MNYPLCTAGALAMLGLVGNVSAVLGQRPEALKPTVFAIRDARVIGEPGKELLRATVVVRDGLIEAVGPNVASPPDALVIDGKGLTVYPGFLDALSNWGFDPGLRRSEIGPVVRDDLASDALVATKADNRKGVTPEFQVASALRAEDQADAWRRAGFTTHLIAPDGGILVGQSALVSLSGAAGRDALLRSPVAHHAAFRPVGGGDYPRVLMGVIAHCRQTLLDAGHYRRTWAEFDKGGRVGKRPPLDPALEALGFALDRRLPVIFEADSQDAIHRALDFAEEFDLRPIIYGGREAWKAAARLKSQRVPVLLRLNFTEPLSGQYAQTLPPRVLEDRKREILEEVAGPAQLHRLGVDFAFSTQGQLGDRPADKFRENLRKAIGAGLPAAAALRALTTNAARILGVDRQVGMVAVGKAAHLVVMDGDFHEAETQVKHTFADAAHFEFETKPRPPKKPEPSKTAPPKKPDPPKAAAPDGPATEIEADRKPRRQTGGTVLIRGATVLTVTNGALADADILVRRGKIDQIGRNLKVTEPTPVLDARGMFVMPGIIDTHCHFAVAGGVNEFSLSVVPEVRVRDVVNGADLQIYRSLAGGVTVARLLHGSANCIGGQDAVIKLKYGRPAHDLVVADGPRGVKFALGENVKRTDGRFPNTRLGVEAVLVRAFSEAQAYRRRWEQYKKAHAAGRTVPEPRRDLRLEALADILKGELKVHCHCYRADEILMLLRVADRFGFKVKSLQHVLEGYKIAPEIADHGASCSTFSDWWAYKIEAYDAIPFNSALLHEAGAPVCLKSDSNELVRHLYQEAAKCVKYGGMSETDALKAITWNAAKQLGLENRLGSIEVGKDADLAIFNGHPLNSYARCEMTLVEGEVFFQRAGDLTPCSTAGFAPTQPRIDFKPIPPNPSANYVISGAAVHPVSGPMISPATLIIEKGRIAAVLRGTVLENAKATSGGKPVSGVAVIDNGKVTFRSGPPGTPVIQANGLHLYPGMIDAGSVLGLTELGSARETHDYAEGGDFQPDLRASIGINPDSELIPVTRANGVTTVVTRPTGAVVAGQSALINLNGWVPREMAVVDPLALHVEFPSVLPMFTGDPTMPAVGRAIARKQGEEKVRRLKELFRQALVYDDARRKLPDLPVNPRLDALVPYARGKKPVVIQAYRKQEILDALKLADELKLRVVLSGAIDAWKVAPELKKRDVPVILGPVMTMPQEVYDPYDAPFTCAAKLHQAGARFCIRSSGSSNTRNLPYEAAMAVSYGLPREEGLKAVTLYPAQILGVADQMGSIEPGKRANLVVTNGDILQASAQVLALFIDGRPVEPVSKQTRLYQRYRERLREVKEGRAPLGTK